MLKRKVILFANTLWFLNRFKSSLILDLLQRDYKVIVVGDATMAPYEITNAGGSIEQIYQKINTELNKLPQVTGSGADHLQIETKLARILVNAEAFNLMKNDAERRTYDDIFWKRMFSSVIVKEANVMDRKISEYMIGLDALLEAERVKAEIFNIEHDLWEY